ncbi:MAG: carboxylate--amine ligase [Ilumatobacter coccineus]|uniref:Carboxylate--amine ligase n=1 Tax=Ilumatobacter coccineus TaxID=467094 RepID=A0A2G6KAV0_9ACTN|nr:MAG: carboxylate--amine ligase [Ilumatobacter coccineus]
MEHLRWQLSPDAVTNPIMITAFTGWNDAGEAASTAATSFFSSTPTSLLADIDPEPFTDFATVRPRVHLTDDRRREIVWPTVKIWAVATPTADLVVVIGPEPALRWRLFSTQITALVDHLGITQAYNLGAFLGDVVHTRATPIFSTTDDPALLEHHRLRPTDYEGPTGIVGVVHDALTQHGCTTVSLWAAVPRYASHLMSPHASIALIERLSSIASITPPTSNLHLHLGTYDAQLAELAAANPDLASYIDHLEHAHDLSATDSSDEGGSMMPSSALDADQLAAEVEQFLRDRTDDDPLDDAS